MDFMPEHGYKPAGELGADKTPNTGKSKVKSTGKLGTVDTSNRNMIQKSSPAKGERVESWPSDMSAIKNYGK